MHVAGGEEAPVFVLVVCPGGDLHLAGELRSAAGDAEDPDFYVRLICRPGKRSLHEWGVNHVRLRSAPTDPQNSVVRLLIGKVPVSRIEAIGTDIDVLVQLRVVRGKIRGRG